MKISVIGLGYVGLANALAFSKYHSVIAYDNNSKKISDLNKGIMPIVDNDMEKFFNNEDLDITFTDNFSTMINNSQYFLLALPTNWNEVSNCLDTEVLRIMIGLIFEENQNNKIIIKSTVPIGFISKIRRKYRNNNILFVPEFLREGTALHDILYPSRIIVGDETNLGYEIGDIIYNILDKNNNTKLLYVSPEEAEAIKLFSNTYLATRVAFFNELDTFAEIENLRTEKIIQGMCLDPRIGNYYNNPSFGYGGYCLPKDTKQLVSNIDISEDSCCIIKATVKSNELRKKFIVSRIMKLSPKKVGIYRLNMKLGSDNIKESAILDIINYLQENKIKLTIYEPVIKDKYFEGIFVEKDINRFAEYSDLIIANRYNEELKPFLEKLYIRDIFYKN